MPGTVTAMPMPSAGMMETVCNNCARTAADTVMISAMMSVDGGKNRMAVRVWVKATVRGSKVMRTSVLEPSDAVAMRVAVNMPMLPTVIASVRN